MQTIDGAIAPKLYLSKGDVVRRFEVVLLNADSEPVNLDGASVLLRRRYSRPGSLTEEFTCSLFNQAEDPGRVRVVWPNGANDIPGDYLANFVATWQGRQDTYPKGYYDYFLIRIHEGL